MCWFGSVVEEKSHSPILTLICDIIKLKLNNVKLSVVFWIVIIFSFL